MIYRNPFLSGLLAFFAFSVGLMLVYKYLTHTEVSLRSESYIGIIDISGVMLDPEPVVKKIQKMQRTSNIRGVVVKINTPGGGVVVAQEIYHALNQLRKVKPVYSSMQSVAASGGYYVACATDKIFANEGSITGSIGVLMEWMNVRDLSDKIGVKPVRISSATNKALMSMYDELGKEKQRILQDMVDDTHQQFVTAVHAGRPELELEGIKKLADGRIMTGRQAYQQGLVDELGSFQQALDNLGQKLGLPAPIKTLKFEDPAAGLLEMLGVSKLKGWLKEIPSSSSLQLSYLMDSY